MVTQKVIRQNPGLLVSLSSPYKAFPHFLRDELFFFFLKSLLSITRKKEEWKHTTHMKHKGQTVISHLENIYHSAQNHIHQAVLQELGNVHCKTEIRISHFLCKYESESWFTFPGVRVSRCDQVQVSCFWSKWKTFPSRCVGKALGSFMLRVSISSSTVTLALERS